MTISFDFRIFIDAATLKVELQCRGRRIGEDFRIFIDAATLKVSVLQQSISFVCSYFRIFIDAATLKDGDFRAQDTLACAISASL